MLTSWVFSHVLLEPRSSLSSPLRGSITQAFPALIQPSRESWLRAGAEGGHGGHCGQRRAPTWLWAAHILLLWGHVDA
jgi:hypothetical protein